MKNAFAEEKIGCCVYSRLLARRMHYCKFEQPAQRDFGGTGVTSSEASQLRSNLNKDVP
ncbi:MAG: hypothetical protein ACK56W_21510 [Pirellula sp.]|nr:hypothetical protein [Pirellula sp.]